MSQEQTVDIEALIPDDHNFNRGTEEGAKLMRKSFSELGAGRSILIDRDNRIIAGNKSQQAAIDTGIKRVRIIETDGTELIAVKRTDVTLDSKEGRELALADNATTQVNLAWDQTELEAMETEYAFDVPEWGVDVESFLVSGIEETEEEQIERKRREFEERMAAGELSEDDPEYQEFIKKFEAKKTTDDCYTPDEIYNAVAEYVSSEYKVSRANFVRPFYPGGDYQKEKYKTTDIVVDNPPFSILSSILDFYNENKIKYFLFGPHLTLLWTASRRCTCIAVGNSITYDNGANISTSFLTNMDPVEIVARSDGRLYKMVDEANNEFLKKIRKKLPKYAYPPQVVMAPLLCSFSMYDIPFVLRKTDSYAISELDAQKAEGKAIFGKGYLISERLVAMREKAEREKAEREKATAWKLSEREQQIIASLK